MVHPTSSGVTKPAMRYILVSVWLVAVCTCVPQGLVLTSTTYQGLYMYLFVDILVDYSLYTIFCSHIHLSQTLQKSLYLCCVNKDIFYLCITYGVFGLAVGLQTYGVFGLAVGLQTL